MRRMKNLKGTVEMTLKGEKTDNDIKYYAKGSMARVEMGRIPVNRPVFLYYPEWFRKMTSGGFSPLLVIQRDLNCNEVNRQEVKGVKKRPVDAKYFRISGDYTRTEGTQNTRRGQNSWLCRGLIRMTKKGEN